MTSEPNVAAADRDRETDAAERGRRTWDALVAASHAAGERAKESGDAFEAAARSAAERAREGWAAIEKGNEEAASRVSVADLP